MNRNQSFVRRIRISRVGVCALAFLVSALIMGLIAAPAKKAPVKAEAPTVAAAKTPAAVASASSGFADKVEDLAARMLPQKKLNDMMGFFGPVTKKYMPVFDQFNAEYLKSANKLAVIRKYLPQADAALAEARQMRVPAKYEARKAEYLRLLSGFLSVTRFTARFGE